MDLLTMFVSKLDVAVLLKQIYQRIGLYFSYQLKSDYVSNFLYKLFRR